jgi:hypothetical protein
MHTKIPPATTGKVLTTRIFRYHEVTASRGDVEANPLLNPSSAPFSTQTHVLHRPLWSPLARFERLRIEARQAPRGRVPLLARCTSPVRRLPKAKDEQRKRENGGHTYLDVTLRGARERVDDDRNDVGERQVRWVLRSDCGYLVFKIYLMEEMSFENRAARIGQWEAGIRCM